MSEYGNNATILSREDINPELMVLKVRPDSGVIVPFEPGQYGELALPELIQSAKLQRRAYSIASAKTTEDHYEFYVVCVQDGAITTKLWELKAGDRLWLGPKVKGKFTLEPVPPDSNIISIATGTGLAPFVSMYRSYRNTGKWRSFTIIHGVRFPHDLGYADELRAHAASDPNFFYIPTVTRAADGEGWTGHHGRVNTVFEDGTYEKVAGRKFEPSTCQLFLCGNPEMIDSMESFLIGRGFKLHQKKEPGQIHLERYW
jgi:ferredoxin--NADP+ reductase